MLVYLLIAMENCTVYILGKVSQTRFNCTKLRNFWCNFKMLQKNCFVAILQLRNFCLVNFKTLPRNFMHFSVPAICAEIKNANL